ncbi:phosphoribosylformylglycinamidine synthase subunit PurQ [Candidatus Pacearchaeota archaeon]|nr:phosphoribosylformylglycinamidine synthase subunit PurQ [Candidatus Pacearchaeota archaeon]
MAKPKTLVLTGYGINCERETAFAFDQAGAQSQIVHVNDLIDTKDLSNYEILAFPGGFSYGDHTGAGKAFANLLRNRLSDELLKFVDSDKLVFGACNGFQIMVALGLLPGIDGDYETKRAILLHNDPTKDNRHGRYLDRWVDLQFEENGIWTKGEKVSLPIAHGEGKFYTDAETMRLIKGRNLIAARYVPGEMFDNYGLSVNPNGALENIAAITNESRRVFGIMPHVERAIDFTHLPDWTLRKEQLKRAGKEIPSEYSGIQILKNGVNYFQ